MITQTSTVTTKPKRLPKAVAESIEKPSLRICFNGELFTIRENKEGLFSLTDIEQAWTASGGTGKRLDNWKANEDVQELISLTEIQVVSKEGGSGPSKGTWGCERAVILYASHCDFRFNLAVVDAFNLLTKGRYEEAMVLADWHVKRKDTKFYLRQVTDALKATVKNPAPYTYSNENKMICKIMGVPVGERDYMDAKQLEQVSYLEKTDAVLIDVGLTYQERKIKLKEMFDKKYPKH